MVFKKPNKTVIPETIETICIVCGKPFRYLQTSTIKEKKCQYCKNQELISKQRIAYNKKILAQANFFDKDKARQSNGHKYPIRTKQAPKKPKKTPKQLARDSADRYFSRFIRLKHSFEQGGELYCYCYTCKVPHHILNIENGHWQRRGYLNTRLNADDCRPQCTQCNRHHSGEPEKFEINLIKELGQDRVDELKVLAQQDFFNDNVIYWREQAALFRLLTTELIKIKGINPWQKK